MTDKTRKTAIQIAVAMSECRTAITENMKAPEGESSEARAEREKRRDEATAKLADLEPEYRAALVLDASERAQAGAPETRETRAMDPEERERLDLRRKASLSRMFAAAVMGNRFEGADEEYRQAVGASERSIPIDYFEREPVEVRADAATAAPGTIGVNMTGLVPAVFTKSIAARIGIQMPRAPSGQYSVPRITTNLTGAAKAKGGAQESTAAAFTIVSAKPRRISARLSLRAEDLAEAGVPGFEASLRQNLMLVLGDVLDTQIITGDGTAPNISGMLHQLTDDADPTAAITFSAFVSDMAGLLDGKWASKLSELRMVTNQTVMGKLAGTLMDGVGDKTKGFSFPGTDTIADWADAKLGGFWCNGRMPAAASDISQCIAVRAGLMLDPDGGAAMPAVLPTWGDIGISDPYSDSASATEHVTLHALIGDKVIIRHPDAFAEVRIKTA
ncbi:MAG: phage major capsid protein [Gammaproteobacteria bacterium]|nr:phage major capsid protein [Gammaproteobacteria bacterium]